MGSPQTLVTLPLPSSVFSGPLCWLASFLFSQRYNIFTSGTLHGGLRSRSTFRHLGGWRAFPFARWLMHVTGKVTRKLCALTYYARHQYRLLDSALNIHDILGTGILFFRNFLLKYLWNCYTPPGLVSCYRNVYNTYKIWNSANIHFNYGNVSYIWSFVFSLLDMHN